MKRGKEKYWKLNFHIYIYNKQRGNKIHNISCMK